MKPFIYAPKKQFALISLVFVLQFLTVFSAWAQNRETEKSINTIRKGEITILTKPGVEIKIEQVSHEFWFGCAISNGVFGRSMSEEDKTLYKEKFLENFNSAVTENAVKWGNMERRKGEVNYSVVDAMLSWTEENNIPLRGHNIFWGVPKFVQPWLKDMNDAELKQTLQNRAESVATRYKGRFVEYDLNNEMVHGNYYEDRLGPLITKQMAQWTRNGDPEIKLFLNDYDILTGNKLPEYLAQIRLLQKQGVEINGIGVQGHLHAETFDRKELKNALDSLAQFGVPIRITEFNFPGQRSKFHKEKIKTMTPEEELLNANELVDYYKICFAHPAVDGILMWGFWEGANWIPASSMYKRDWTITKAGEAYQKIIFNEWWTKDKGTVSNTGKYAIQAFYGKYNVSANGVTKEVDLTKSNGKVVVEF